MGLYEDMLAVDNRAFFDGDGVSEVVVYTPLGGSAKNVNASVIRGVPQETAFRRQAVQHRVNVIIPNDATTGVTSIDTGGDTVAVAERYGGTAKTFRVKSVVDSDPGSWHLELQ